MKIIECGKYGIDYNTFFRVQWSLTNKCNYNCYYCNSNNNKENFSDLLTVEKIIDFINILSKIKNVDIRLFGGEPTIHPHFKKILTDIETKNILLWTNLSQSESFFESIKNISIKYRCSLHLKYSETNSFLKKIKVLKENNNIFVNVMTSFDNVQTSVNIYNQIKKWKTNNFNCSLDKIFYDNEKFSNDDNIIIEREQLDHINNGYYIVYLKNGITNIKNISYNTITNNQWNNFYLFNCLTKSNSIFIDFNGDVYNCVTYKTKGFKPFFNIVNDDISIFFNEISKKNFCLSKICTCEYDIKKIKIF